jgi:uncharacterized repeat protein (TIGR01451 family)
MKNGKGMMAVVGMLALLVGVCFADDRNLFDGDAKPALKPPAEVTRPEGSGSASGHAAQVTETSLPGAEVKDGIQKKPPQESRIPPFGVQVDSATKSETKDPADQQFWSSLDDLKRKRDRHNVHADYHKNPIANPVRTVQASEEDVRFELTPFEVIDEDDTPAKPGLAPTAPAKPTPFAEPLAFQNPVEPATGNALESESTTATTPVNDVANETFTGAETFSFELPESIPSPQDTAPSNPDVMPNVVPATRSKLSTTAADARQEPVEAGANPVVTVEWVKSGPLNVGQEADCFLVVRNSGTGSAGNVALDVFFPAKVELINVDPKPESTGEFMTWSFGELAAGEERRIHVQMIPRERGDVRTRAFVRSSGLANGLFVVHEPMLKVAIRGPEKTLVNEPAPHVITVSNPGTGIARNVVVKVAIPPGLKHRAGERLVLDIGQLNPGESRDVRLALTATDGGNHALRTQSTADGSLVDTAEAMVVVVAPKLQLEIDGPKLRYVGRKATFTLNLTNDGSATSNNVRAKYQIPDGFRFASADRGGKHDATSNSIHWFIGPVNPGESSEFKVQLLAYKLGEYSHQAGAVSEGGHSCSAQHATRVDGIASLVIEIVDRDDPLEVGGATVYQIRVSNEGSKAAQNVGLSCELPTGIRMVAAKGASEHSMANGMLAFDPIRSLPPGKTAIFEVEIRSIQAGSHRFRARVVSDSLQQPLVADELTQVYSD